MKLKEVRIPVQIQAPDGQSQIMQLSIEESEQLRKYLYKAEIQAAREVEASQVLH